jgi:hypothetical protein
MTDDSHPHIPDEQGTAEGRPHLEDEALSALIDDEDTGDDVEAVRRHLASCELCSSTMRGLEGAARAVRSPVEAPPALMRDYAVARALAAADHRSNPTAQESLAPIPIARRQRSAHLGGIAAAIVAVATLTVGGVILTSSGNGSPSSAGSAHSKSASLLPAASPSGAAAPGSPSALQLRPIIGSSGTGCASPNARAVPAPGQSTDLSNEAARPVAGAEAGCVQLGPALLTLAPPLAGVHEVIDAAAGYGSIVVDVSPSAVAPLTRWQNANVFGSIAAVAGDAVIGYVGAAGEGPTGKQAPQVDIIFVQSSLASQETAALGGH